MISVIIASTDQNLLHSVSENINDTIGVEFEIISFENSKGERGLCDIYNEGAKKAKYELICYMHEDVNIKTKNWGNIVNQTFTNAPTIGLIGLAGSSFKTIVPSGWFCDAGAKKTNYVNLLQRYRFNETETKHVLENLKDEKFSKVAVVDGVWFCTKKKIVALNSFDEQTFKKFHCYDLDFSLQVGRTFQVVVTFEILLEHFSEGNYDKTWIEETLKLHKKWINHLPIDLDGLAIKEKFIAEKYSYRVFLKQMKSSGYKKIDMLKAFWNSGLINRNLGLFLKLHKEIWRS